MAQQFGAQFEQMQSAANHVAEVNQSVQGLAPARAASRPNLNEALNSIGEQIRGSGTTYAQADENENQTYSRISQALGS